MEEELRDTFSTSQNTEKVRKRDPRFRGVSRAGSSWKAQVTSQGICHYLGSFPTTADAADACEKKRNEIKRAKSAGAISSVAAPALGGVVEGDGDDDDDDDEEDDDEIEDDEGNVENDGGGQGNNPLNFDDALILIYASRKNKK